jgi:hypothetical protein
MTFCPKDSASGLFPGKPTLIIGSGDEYALGSTVLTNNVWYKLIVNFTAGLNNTTAQIRDAATDALISSLTVPEDKPLRDLGTVSMYSNDVSTDTSEYAEFVGIVACDHTF